MKNFSTDYNINDIPFNEIILINNVKMIRCIFCGELNLINNICKCNIN
jgi:hypothetical protein